MDRALMRAIADEIFRACRNAAEEEDEYCSNTMAEFAAVALLEKFDIKEKQP